MPSGRFIIPLATPCLSAEGLPVTGATLQIQIAGGPTLASLFADAALSTPVANPQAGIYASDSAGRFFAQTETFFADSTQAYDVYLSFPDGETFVFEDQYLLGEATNTSGFAPIFSPILTGNPQAPTPSLSNNSNSLATTAFVMGQDYAPLDSPALTGVPTAPTAASGTDTTQIATTAFVEAAAAFGIATLGASGYIQIPVVVSGARTLFYIQWGQVNMSGANSQVIAFPVAFPTAAYGALAGLNSDQNNQFACTAVTTTGMKVYATAGGAGTYAGYYIAWGY